MKSTENVLPSHPEIAVTILAKDQPEYIPLPVAHIEYQDGQHSMISRYRLTWKERLRILFTGSLWIEQLTAGRLLQPQRPTVYEPLTDSDIV